MLHSNQRVLYMQDQPLLPHLQCAGSSMSMPEPELPNRAQSQGRYCATWQAGKWAAEIAGFGLANNPGSLRADTTPSVCAGVLGWKKLRSCRLREATRCLLCLQRWAAVIGVDGRLRSCQNNRSGNLGREMGAGKRAVLDFRRDISPPPFEGCRGLPGPANPEE
jgi:hypothetical protein